MKATERLYDLGQSFWLDNITRGFLVVTVRRNDACVPTSIRIALLVKDEKYGFPDPTYCVGCVE